jgi:integrase
MARRNLTDRFIKTRPPAPPGQRLDYWDALVPGLALRVTDRGHKSFVLIARFPLRPKNPTRRALGNYGTLTLEEARQKAREWLAMIGRGVDPRIDEERRKAAARRRQANTFAAVADDFITRHIDVSVKNLGNRRTARRIIEGEFVERWGARPITDIAPLEVAAAIRAIVDRGARYQAHNAFGFLRGLFHWAIGTGEYGIEASPLARLQPAKLIGAREARTRTLTDVELRAVWQAAESTGYPYGPVFQLLILTGQREHEVADMSWSEVDLEGALWAIPRERMKGAAAHEVPLGPAALALLQELPRGSAGDFVFSLAAGKRPVNSFPRAKAALDQLCGVDAWRIHDLRRTMRTHLSALPVQDLVRELVIAHEKPGLHKVYDQHAYQCEKRQCLLLWEQRLLAIVAPPGGKQVTWLPARRAAV